MCCSVNMLGLEDHEKLSDTVTPLLGAERNKITPSQMLSCMKTVTGNYVKKQQHLFNNNSYSTCI